MEIKKEAKEQLVNYWKWFKIIYVVVITILYISTFVSIDFSDTQTLISIDGIEKKLLITN